ncbi:MAG: hypothetical protein KJ737_12300 [Proteobacteria bacterium]|nr:hypothetical protein [Pseudomonadota bacterium]
MKKLIVLPFLICLITSCASIPRQAPDLIKDQFRAENRLMKKNLDLALRENEVLKTENLQYKSKVNQLNKTVSKFKADLESLNNKYNEDMIRMNEDYETICANLTALEEQSDAKIEELTRLNSGLEKKLSDDVARLNGQLDKQQLSFTAERKLLKAGYESKMLELENQLSLSKQESDKKDAAIASMTADLKEAQARIVDMEKTVKEQNEMIKKGEKERQELTQSSQDLQKITEEKRTMIDESNPKTGTIQPPAQQKNNE